MTVGKVSMRFSALQIVKGAPRLGRGEFDRELPGWTFPWARTADGYLATTGD